MAYFLISNGVVIQKQPNEESGFVEGPEDAICGFLFDGEAFSAPPSASPSDTRRASLTTAINAHVTSLLAAGAPIPVGETTLHVAIDDGSRADMGGMALTASLAKSGAAPWPDDYSRGWITIENIRIPLPTPDDGIALAYPVGLYYAAVRQRGRDLKDAIEAAADDAALDAIDIESGWPG